MECADIAFGGVWDISPRIVIIEWRSCSEWVSKRVASNLWRVMIEWGAMTRWGCRSLSRE